MAARAWQDTLRMKTYPLGPDDPNPPFQRQNGSWAIYPYTMQDDLLEGPPTERDWVALHIENEYLHAIVLPELGGHLHSLYDKVTKREVFYCNHVVKHGLVAIRGAWISGGIEFSFPTGHTHTTVDKVSWEIGTGGPRPGIRDRRAAWIRVGNVDRLSRMRWSVTLSLREGVRILDQAVCIENPTPFKQRHWFWSNSAVPATRDLRLVYPARKASTGGRIVDFPVADGVDISRYTAMNHAADIFAIGVKEDFFGCHYEESDFGLVHVADRRQVIGKKYFTWGTADDGMVWVDLLTDTDGQYVEIQSGRFETQAVWEFLRPFEAAYWQERWMPEHGMGGWTWANDHGVLQFEARDGRLRLGALTPIRHDEALLVLEAAGKPVWRQALAVGPEQPFRTDIPLPPGCREEGPFDLRLVNPRTGHEIVGYEHPPAHTRQPKVAETGENIVPLPKPEEELTAEELCVRAADALRRLEFARARRLYEKALALEPGFAIAHLGLGILGLRNGRFAAARDHLEKAIARDRENDEAWFNLGLARAAAGDPEGAADAFWEAERRQGPAGPAFMLLPQDLPAWLDCPREQDAPGAKLWAGGTDAGWHPPADESLEDPPDPVLSFARWARGDVQNWLEAAFSFGGPKPEAVRTLELACEHCPAAASYPITHYTLAQWYDSIGRADQAAAAHARARACPPDHCFPSRLEELEVLGAAVARDPGDWKARYLLGNLLASLDRTEEAMQQWREAAKLDATFAVLHRNLGLGALRWEHKPEEAAEHYRHAIACNPLDYRYYLDLANLLAHDLQRPAEEVLALLRSAPSAIQEKWQVAARIADVLTQLRRYNEALETLRAHKFFPWEGARQMRATYVNCLAGRAEEAAAQGDHRRALADLETAMDYPRNLAVGKSAKPQDARVYWLAAREAAALGDEAKQGRYLLTAAEEPHREPCEAGVYKMRAQRQLGRDAEAAELERQLREWARRNAGDAEHGTTAAAIVAELAGK